MQLEGGLMKLKGRVAIITGAAKGIGREIAIAFAKEGAAISLVDIDIDNLENVYKEVTESGGNIVSAKVDVSKSSEVQAMVARTLEKLGKIDILVNNAAYVKYGKFLEFQEDEMSRIIDVGLKGYFLCAQIVGREMVKNRYGKIVNMASVAAELGFQNGVAYCSAKGGVVGLTKALAIELAPHRINVNAIAPGPTDTGGLRSLISKEEMEGRLDRIPMGRLAEPRDIANAALFLASEESDYITGHILKVDGGFTALGIRKKD